MKKRKQIEERKDRSSARGHGKATLGIWGPLISCMLAFLVYLPSLFLSFIHDDHPQILKNPQVQSWDYLPRLLTTHLWSQQGGEELGYYYRPVFSMWMLLVHTVGGLSAWFWHLASILLHTAAAYLVFEVCKKLLDNDIVALLGTVLFALHPIHVDAVSWISASNEILFTIFILGAISFMLRAFRTAPKKSGWLVLSVLLYTTALFTKETAVALWPLLLALLLLALPCSPRWRERLQETLRLGSPYLASVAIYLFVRWVVLGRMGVETGKHSWQDVLWNSPPVMVFYLKKLVWPFGLSGFYMNPLSSSPTLGMWLTLLGILAVVAIIASLAFRCSPLIALAGALIFLPVIPVLVGIRVYDQGNMTHDRYLYLPSVGLALLFGLVARGAWSTSRTARNTFAGIAGLLAVTCTYLTLAQQRFYKDDEAFYQRGIEVSPGNVLVIDYLGNFYLTQGYTERALTQFRTAHQLAPDDVNATFFLARGLFEAKQYGMAEPLFNGLADSAAPLRPRRKAMILLSLADVEIMLGKLDDATLPLRKLESLDPNYPALHRTMAILFQRQGRIREAQTEYAKEFQVSGDREARQQAIALARVLLSPR